MLISTDSMNMIPMNNPVGAVVEFANAGNVDSIFVAGKARKRNGKLLDLDFASFRKQVDAARDGLFARAGVPDRRLVDRQALCGRARILMARCSLSVRWPIQFARPA